MKAVRIGELRHKIVIQRRKRVYSYSSQPGQYFDGYGQPVLDGYGQEVEEWVDFATTWAKVEEEKGREVLANGGKTVNIVNYLFTIRWREGIHEGMRVLWRGKPVEIESVFDPDGRGVFLTLAGKAVV